MKESRQSMGVASIPRSGLGIDERSDLFFGRAHECPAVLRRRRER